jgi:NSS family neurotransmitter:Na+ symporter
MMDRFKLSRGKSVAICIVICILLGIPSSLGNGIWADIKILGMDFLTFFDYLSNSLIMPFVALCTCILVGWVIGPELTIREITKNGEKMGRKKMYRVMIKYIAPILLVVILVSYSLAQFGIITM